MSKLEFDADPLNGSDSLDEIVGIVEEGSLTKATGTPTESGIEYTITTNEEGGVVYRVVQVEEDNKMNLSTASGAAVLPQNCQYVLFDGSNGYIQALGTTNVNTSATISSNNVVRPRPSVAIAPKADRNNIEVSAKPTTNVRSTNAVNLPSTTTVFKKRDDRRRATHNEVERRRRDKINHWIMKLGSIIPADGTSVEIGDSGRTSIATVEGQSKGGILSKACEYVQMLQEQQPSSTESSLRPTERKHYEDEIVCLRQENEILKRILRKHGIQHAFDTDDIESS